MANRKKRTEEKERLMQEVLGKDRTSVYGVPDATKHIELTIGNQEQEKKETQISHETMYDSDDAMSALNEVLLKQQKELEEMSKDSGFSDADMKKFQDDIQKDYDVKLEEQDKKSIEDSKEVFDDIYDNITSKIMGQKDALHQLIVAFRRPYVMGVAEGKARNVILVSGPNGSGRHTAVKQMARSLYEKQIFISDEVYTVDMSLYTSGSQEQIFLQDLYKDLHGKGSVICFENFENGFPAFLRMIDSLVCDGKIILNKRYVESKGMLVEAQTGLVKDTVDSLSAEGKYLVFISSGPVEKVLDSFGADFIHHVLDQVQLKTLDEESVMAIIKLRTDELIAKTYENLKLNLTIHPEVQKWIAKHFDKEAGAESITSYFSDFYLCLAQEVLNTNPAAETKADIVMNSENEPQGRIEEQIFTVLRQNDSEAEIAAVNKELDEVVGLNMVKDYIRSLQSHIKIQKIRREQGLKTSEISKHMIFTGNPGTGKTTIARLISRYMKAIGALSQGQLVEVTRADLVAQYVGQTAPLTMSVIKSAIGGVLFIDEAYSLYRGKDDSFGLECIDTLVKAMEDNRDDLIVILAGYKKEMAGFLESNSGLKSRFPNLIDFPDYTAEELLEISDSIAKHQGYRIDEQAKPPLKEYFEKVQSINAAEAGNGRMARNEVEEAILHQSDRLSKNPGSDMEELLKEDFELTVKVKPPVQEENPFASLLK